MRVRGGDRSSGHFSTCESHDVSTPCRFRTTNLLPSVPHIPTVRIGLTDRTAQPFG